MRVCTLFCFLATETAGGYAVAVMEAGGMRKKRDSLMAEERYHIDELTGLHSLTGILEHLQGHGEFAASLKTVIIYINIMNFKSFNKRYGFSGGNEFIKGMAMEILGVFPDELVARASGDHFIILSNSLTEKEITGKLDELRDIAHKYEKGLVMRIKAGVYLARGDEEDPVVMVDRAKVACDDIIRVYDRDTNFYSDELEKRNRLRQYVLDNFETAFNNRYFKVYYQKEVRTLTRNVCGYEALARWMDPEYGIIAPGLFIEVLEDVRLVHKLDTYIIEQVCADLRKDIDLGHEVEPVSVNLSRLDFELCDILGEVDKCRDKYGIPKNLLNIEITESAVAAGADFLGDQIRTFRNAGYEVWMDDFGAGYSSFNNLKSYDFDVVKIDMNFLREFQTNKKSRVILANIVDMAKELGIHTIAEGVETEEQYEFLKRIGCEKLQGYLFGKPEPLSESGNKAISFGENCESMEIRNYYDKIGEINLLGNTPLRPKTMEVFNNLPIAILEAEGDNMKMLYMNNAYETFLNTIGIANMDEVNDRFKDSELPDVKGLKEITVKAESSLTSRAEADYVVGGSVVNSKVRFISRQGDKASFALVSRNVTLYSDGHLADSVQAAMAHIFNQYFRVDIFDDSGTVENIFLKGDQVAIADRVKESDKAIRTYADLYISKSEAERFVNFYDMTTVKDRIKQSESDYLVDCFHSSSLENGGRMQMYMIIPFYYNNKWKYISCCRYADEMVGSWRNR